MQQKQSENKKLVIIRHLPRIDDSDSSIELSRRWNMVDSRLPQFVDNHIYRIKYQKRKKRT